MSELAEKLAKLKATAVDQLTQVGVSDIDHELLDTLVDRLKLIVDNKDAILVSGTDPAELETVRRNFVVKKLGINDKDAAMAAIQEVVTTMSPIKMKNRAAFYYLVQKKMS